MEDGRLLAISSDITFDSIIDLIQYYKDHSFYKGCKLERPVTPELYRLSMNKDEDGQGKIYSCPEYTNQPKNSIKVPFKPY